MKVLVIGSGAREHAIAWKLSRDKKVEEIFAIPGNAGISEIAKCIDIMVDDIESIVKFAKETKIDWTVVGPEYPLTLGIVDAFEREGLKIWGPRKEPAKLESSKAFAKEIMRSAKIPTAEFKVFDDFNSAVEFVKNVNFPVVIKADGLCAGKGVKIVESFESAVEVLRDFMIKKVFGKSGEKVVIEEFLKGVEFSLITIVKNNEFYYLPPAQDYKRIGEGNTGENTGGMGSFAPVPWINEEIIEKCTNRIFKPLMEELYKRNIYYTGFLYGGFILVNNDPYVLEFNVRLGDPEAQVILPLLDYDLSSLLENKDFPWNKQKKALCVVLASKGYPGHYETGKEITFKNINTEDIYIFHAGTVRKDGKLLTAGGRVLSVVGVGNDFQSIRSKVYKTIEEGIFFDNMYYRRDIGKEVI
ncbi:MAG: phosphoribosylamine--glycine ligase [Dictyoglomus sp. NZ13-RE01]|nr:MAG: phosphoribosylamine--glycine ligase [Dictyoglomus sp. NZ13-RE01]